MTAPTPETAQAATVAALIRAELRASGVDDVDVSVSRRGVVLLTVSDWSLSDHCASIALAYTRHAGIPPWIVRVRKRGG